MDKYSPLDGYDRGLCNYKTLREVSKSTTLHIVKFIYGSLFGSLVWLIIVKPYKYYYDFEFGSHWPEFVFSIMLGLLFMTSLSTRSILTLFLPSLVGGATQNYIILLLFTALFGSPLKNIALNSVESVRAIGCSLTMTFDQLKERAKLVLNPIVEILSDRDKEDMDPIRKDLIQIQHIVSEIRRNAQLVADSKSSSYDERVRRRDVIDPAVTTNQTARGNKNDTEPSARRYPDVQSKLTNRTTSNTTARATNQRHSFSSNGTAFTATRATESSLINKSKGGVSLEWDLDNFGVKANVDMKALRELAKAGKLRQFFGLNATSKYDNMNITDILYASCMGIFRDAKETCTESVNNLYSNCKGTIGPVMATWWCAPFTTSLESFCPWIMDQIVDEKSLCKQVKIVDATSERQRQIKIGNQTLDVNGAFRELNRQIEHLNEHFLIDNDGGGGGNSTSLAAAERRQLNRLEISLTFNEKTREIFVQTKKLIAFITDKYKMRQLLVDALLFVYDVYTTYTFALIMGQAWRYRQNYLTNIKFDNCYITRDFIRLDASYRRGGGGGSSSQHKALSIGSAKSSSMRSSKSIDDNGVTGRAGTASWRLSSSVLPLTKDESKRYIPTLTCKRRTQEERHVQSVSCTTILIFIAFTLSLLYLDNIFYSLLVSIHDHSLIRFKELGHHELDIKVSGDGVIARLVKRLVANLSSVYNLDRYTSTRQCLPVVHETTNRFYLEFFSLVAIYFIINQISIYAMRFRRVTCAHFYPDKELQRVEYLHKFIRYQRHKLASSGLKGYLNDDLDDKGYNESSVASKATGLGSKRANGSSSSVAPAIDDARVDYSLKDALVYLKNCVTKSAKCCRYLDNIFPSSSSPSTATVSKRKRNKQAAAL